MIGSFTGLNDLNLFVPGFQRKTPITWEDPYPIPKPGSDPWDKPYPIPGTFPVPNGPDPTPEAPPDPLPGLNGENMDKVIEFFKKQLFEVGGYSIKAWHVAILLGGYFILKGRK